MSFKKIAFATFATFTFLGFSSVAFASITLSGTGITGDSLFNSISGANSTSIDLGSGNTLSLQNTNNGPITTGSGLFTVGGNLAVGANNITMTGSLGATGARLTKGWFTDLQVTNPIAGSVTGSAASATTAITATTAGNLFGGAGGSIPYQTASGTTALLSNGSAGQVLQSNGTTLAPSWVPAGAGDMLLGTPQTVTGAKTFGTIGGAVGKLILAGSTSGSTILNANATAGSGTVVLPVTGTLATLAGTEAFTNKDLTGTGNTFPTFNQNTTGIASFASNLLGGLGGSIPYQSASGTTALLANGNAGQVLTSNGTTLAPSWGPAGAGDMLLGTAQTVTGAKTFGTIGGAVGKLILAGSTSGSTILNANATAGSGTVVLPTTGTLATLAGSEAFTNKDLTGAGNVFPSFSNFVTVAYSATPTFTAGSSVSDVFKITLTGNVTSSTFVPGTAGEKVTFLIYQDGTGGRTFVWPTNVLGACGVSGTANGYTQVTGTYDGSNIIAQSCTNNDPATQILGPEKAAITSSAAGTGVLTFDSGSHTTTYYANGSTNRHIMPRVASGDQVAFSDITGTANLASQITGTLPAANGGTGVSNTSSLTLGTSNVNLATLGTGIVKNTTTTGALTLATSSDIIGLFSGGAGCTGTNYLAADGTCRSAAGSGTVTSSGSPVSGNISKFTTATNIAPATSTDIIALFGGAGGAGCTGTNYLAADGTCRTASGGSGYATIQSAGSAVTQRPTVNFISGTNATVSCVDNSGSTRTDCTVSASAGSSSPTFPVNPQTATYQTIASDFTSFKTIAVSSGTFTITLVASGSQPASGTGIRIINYGSGTITVARSGQNINGAASNLTIAPGSASAPNGAWIVSDGTDYVAQPLLGSASGSGASTDLSNLTTTNINQALLPQSGKALGSATNNWNDLYMNLSGTYGTGYVHFTGTPTAARTINVADANTATVQAVDCSTTAGQVVKKIDANGLPGCTTAMGQMIVTGVTNVTVTNGTPIFVGLGGGGINVAENIRTTPMASVGTLKGAFVYINASQSAAGALVCTWRKGSNFAGLADTSVVVTIPANSVSATYSDTTDSFTYNAGDLVDIRCQQNTGGTSAPIVGISNMVYTQ